MIFNFIAELFDKLNADPEINKSLLNNDDNSLSYKKIFSDQDLLKTTKNNWVYNKLFNHYPSKILLEEMNSKEFKNVIETLLFLELQIDKSFLVSLDKEYSEFCKSIENNKSFLKNEIWKKLNARELTSNNTYDETKTLFQQYNKNIDYTAEKKFILENSIHLNNSITKRSCSKHIDMITLIKQSSLLHRRDIYIQSIFLDKSFLANINRLLFVTDICDGVMGVIKHLYPQKICIVSENAYLNSNHIGSRNVMKYLKCATYGSSPENTFYVSPLLKKLFSIFPDIIDDITYSYFHRTIPQNILDGLIEYYLKFRRPLEKRKCMTENCIVLIDNRRNFLSLLSILINKINVDWDIVICTSHKNRDFYEKNIPNVKFIDHDLMNIERKFEMDDYNSILKSSAFWKQLLCYKHALVVQDDGYVLKKGIERFLKYDYVGAPWDKTHVQINHIGETFVGNGGLSLRRIGSMIECIESNIDSINILFNKNNQVIPEDVFFSKFIENKPSYDEASKFSFEMVYEENALGFHKPWAYLQHVHIVEFINATLNV